jgi:hypothetical protein
MGCVSTISVSVRSAVPADAMEVARVHVHSWQVAYRGLLPDAFLEGLRAEDRAGHYTFALPGEEPATIVALEAGVIRGFATIGSAAGSMPAAWVSCSPSTSTPATGDAALAER